MGRLDEAYDALTRLFKDTSATVSKSPGNTYIDIYIFDSVCIMLTTGAPTTLGRRYSYEIYSKCAKFSYSHSRSDCTLEEFVKTVLWYYCVVAKLKDPGPR